LNKNGIKIEVVNNVDTYEEDIIQDFVSIITSFTARIYGKRRSKRKTEQLIKELKSDD
jgi:putative resolvase